MKNTTYSWSKTAGFTVLQLVGLVVAVLILAGGGYVVYHQIHTSSSANGGLTPISTKADQASPATQDAARAAQIKRMCASLTPEQIKLQQQVHRSTVCTEQQTQAN